MIAGPLVDVDIEVEAGTFELTARFACGPGITTLFGPSGSGKSLTLATVAGIVRPRTGRIVIHGRTVADTSTELHVRTQQRSVGLVTQHAALLPHLDPIDNVALAVRVGTRTERRATARAYLGEVGAGALVDRPASALSGGEQQRVALARALAGKPSVLLLDEPFSALDQPSRIDLRRIVRRIVADYSIPALLVTHDLDDAAELADRIVRYEPGRVVDWQDLGEPRRAELARIVGFGSQRPVNEG